MKREGKVLILFNRVRSTSSQSEWVAEAITIKMRDEATSNTPHTHPHSPTGRLLHSEHHHGGDRRKLVHRTEHNRRLGNRRASQCDLIGRAALLHAGEIAVWPSEAMGK